MASNDELPLLVHSSDNIEQGARLAWNQVSSVAEDVPEPTIGKAAGFLPSELCYKAMNLALEEYLQKVEIASLAVPVIPSNNYLDIYPDSTPKNIEEQKGRRGLLSWSA